MSYNICNNCKELYPSGYCYLDKFHEEKRCLTIGEYTAEKGDKFVEGDIKYDKKTGFTFDEIKEKIDE